MQSSQRVREAFYPGGTRHTYKAKPDRSMRIYQIISGNLMKNYLKISMPDVLLSPYIGWELFYEDHYKEVNLHRIKIGITKNIYHQFSLGFFYRTDFSQIENVWQFSKMQWAVQTIFNF